MPSLHNDLQAASERRGARKDKRKAWAEASASVWKEYEAAGLRIPDGRRSCAGGRVPAHRFRSRTCRHARLSPQRWDKWREGMKRLADQPNVCPKFSGLGTFIRYNDPQHIAEIVNETIALFSAERCMWGSNFPVEKIWTDYRSIVEAIRAAVADLDPKARAAILHDTASRIYRL